MTWPTTHAIDHDADADTQPLLDREWLLTNGEGGYAMSTTLGVNTRRYHGLLVAASRPPVGRVVVLNQLFEQLELIRDGVAHRLAFGGCLFLDQDKPVIAPDCTAMLRRFDRGLEAVWSYQWGELTFTRTLILHDRKPACTVRYDLTGLSAVCQAATLHVRPMISLRNFHSLERRDDQRFTTQADADTLTVCRDQLTACYHAPGAIARDDHDWWYNIHHPVEAYRGSDHQEDLYLPGTLSIDLGSRDDAAADFTASLGPTPAKPIADASARAKRLQPIADALANALPATKNSSRNELPETLPAILAQASDDFIVHRSIADQSLSTIIAGYPWFADWGRDTFIALPGLLLATGRTNEARDTLRVFANAIDHGLVPNRFDDNDPTLAHYNTVDGSLWFLHSALQYQVKTDDAASWNNWLAEACIQIVEAYRNGTRAIAHDGQTPIPIAMDDDGLISAGDTHSQLTWMDAAAWGPDGKCHVFTPRPGKCVEINGLWYSALSQLAYSLPDAFSKHRDQYAQLAQRVRKSFTQAFWSDSLGYFIDHLAPTDEGYIADRSLRPNQLIACALEHSPADPAHRHRALAVCRDRLLTPVGPRTLPVDDPEFHPRYAGNVYQRDAAYHRGTVWPWLIGPYAEALLRDGRFSEQAKAQARQALAPLVDRLTTTNYPGALGTLHEIHEPLDPFPPRGCPAQAWSVAETLRVLTLLK